MIVLLEGTCVCLTEHNLVFLSNNQLRLVINVNVRVLYYLT